MSYDINIWSVKPVSAARDALAKNGFAQHAGGGFYLEGKGWQIALHAHPVKDEDIPDAAMGLLAGIGYGIQLSLEPGVAPPAAYALLRKIAKMLSQQTTGVIEDPQEGSFALASGVQKYASAKHEKKERLDLLQMSWWFDNNSLSGREKILGFVKLLERHLPEALPRRYGTYEPPQFTYAETGMQHFVDFLANEKLIIAVCYPTKPVWGIHFGLSPKSGFVKNGLKRRYKCSYLTISLDAAVLEQEHWQTHLHKTWKVLSQAIVPFYGDVRILKNYFSGRATYAVGPGAESHPVGSWWWRGVPSKPAQAVVVGDPYINLWPEVRAAGSLENDLYFISAKEWSETKTVEPLLKVPQAIAQPANPQPQKVIINPEEFRAMVQKRKKEGPPPVTTVELPESFPFADDDREEKPATA